MNGELLKKISSIDLTLLKTLRREAVGGLILVVFSFVFFRFIYPYNTRQISSLEAEMTNAGAEIDRINSEMQAAERLGKAVTDATVNLNILEGRLKDLNERLPSDKHVSRILSEISENGFSKGVRITSIKPMPAEDKGELSRLPFQISLETRYTSFGNYLEMIENLPRLMVVDNFMIEQKDDTSLILNSQLYLSAYVLNAH